MGSNPTLSAIAGRDFAGFGTFWSLGEVSEWPNERAWKARVSQGTVGSNPTLSAISSFFAAGAGGPAPRSAHAANRVRPGTEQP